MTGQPVERWSEDRGAPRDEVLHRARLTLADGRALPCVVVNLSPGGLMARVEVTAAALAAGDAVVVALPVIGAAAATVRWALGGRIGCRFAMAIDARDYPAVLAAMRR